MAITQKQLVELLSCAIIQGDFEEDNITGGYTSDLLSDVMAHAQEGQALITIQSHRNSVAVATLYGAPCIIICNDRPVPEDMISAAREEGIAIYLTGRTQFEISGILYSALNS
jgi:serine kinase of HPr protein (carbohydrate metabolism regulator)